MRISDWSSDVCSSDLAPITGVAHVAYRPGASVVGISKLSRLVDAYARRLQLQERLTSQIAHTLDDVLEPRGVAVVIAAHHGCMYSGGVTQHRSEGRRGGEGCGVRRKAEGTRYN